MESDPGLTWFTWQGSFFETEILEWCAAGIFWEEENVSYLEYENKDESICNKKKKILSKTEKINNLIEEYKNMESVLIKNESNRNDSINLWYECLKQLNTLDHNPNSNS